MSVYLSYAVDVLSEVILPVLLLISVMFLASRIESDDDTQQKTSALARLILVVIVLIAILSAIAPDPATAPIGGEECT